MQSHPSHDVIVVACMQQYSACLKRVLLPICVLSHQAQPTTLQGPAVLRQSDCRLGRRQLGQLCIHQQIMPQKCGTVQANLPHLTCWAGHGWHMVCHRPGSSLLLCRHLRCAGFCEQRASAAFVVTAADLWDWVLLAAIYSPGG